MLQPPRLPHRNQQATLCGINERNDNRQPVTLWGRETAKMPWAYLSKAK
ncbi:hypothetical protein [Prosthecobacter sp.]